MLNEQLAAALEEIGQRFPSRSGLGRRSSSGRGTRAVRAAER